MFSKKQSLFYQIFKNSQGEKKIAPRLAPRRKSCSALITACSREILSKNMLRVYTIIRDSRVLFMYPFSFRLDTIFEKPVAKKPHLDTLHAVKNYSMSCGTGLNGYN